jgi:hypothetical protein
VMVYTPPQSIQLDTLIPQHKENSYQRDWPGPDSLITR